MNGNIIGIFIYFWAFMIGVLVFGKVFGFMNDARSTIMIMIAAAIVFVVWVIGRSKAAKRRAQKEWDERQAKAAKRKGGKRH